MSFVLLVAFGFTILRYITDAIMDSIIHDVFAVTFTARFYAKA